MKILPLETEAESTLSSFLANSLFNPFAVYGVGNNVYVDLVLSELSDIVSKGGFVLVAKEDREIVGLISLTRSEWDSQHFGIEISKIDHLIAAGDYFISERIKRFLISNLLAICTKTLWLHVSTRVNKEDLSSIHALESKYFRLMDILVTYSLDFRDHPQIHPENQHKVRKFRPEEIPELEQMAHNCFQYNTLVTDRFHADPVFSKEKSGEVYSKWLVNSSKDPSSEILVAEIEGKIVGFNVCNIKNSLSNVLGLRLGSIVLTAVESSSRNKLVATSLINASLEWFAGKVDVIETGGQVSNYAIQRTWNDVGLKITRAQCTFHWSVLTESM